MGWKSSGTFNGLDWTFTDRISVTTGKSIDKIYTLKYSNELQNWVTPRYNWDTTKTYQIITQTLEHYATAASFSVSPNWLDKLAYQNGATPSGAIPSGTQSFYHYSTPTSNISSNIFAKYEANGSFNATAGIIKLDVNEINFSIQGFAYYKLTNKELQDNSENGLGWYYDKTTDTYFWYDRISLSTSDLYPIGGSIDNKESNIGYRLNNYIAKNVPFEFYNLSFKYQNSSNTELKIYIGTLPSTGYASTTTLINNSFNQPGTLIGTLTQSYNDIDGYGGTSNHNFYGLRGNQYLYFVGPCLGYTQSNSTSCTVSVSNIQIYGGYHMGNNKQYLLEGNSESLSIDVLTGATYSSVVGSGNTVNATQSLAQLNSIFSKIGNGTFKTGVWENGVWNSGWRKDDDIKEFYDVYQSFCYNKSNKWRIQLIGPTASVNYLNIGDNISIGNIIAIDINENRKLLKNYFKIIAKTETPKDSIDSIIVEFDNNFPLRRIEKDSEYHRIYVTRNIWLSGGFLNGYFTGIWNYGLFKGYPLLTEMYNSHWIDGVFDGGHFKADKYTIPDFKNTIFHSSNEISITNNSEDIGRMVGKVGLTFSEEHGLSVGDLITIDKYNKTINIEYDGDTRIISVVNPYEVITNIDWLYDYYQGLSQSGRVNINLSKGLIQNVTFKSNNISKMTSVQSNKTNDVFMYNSWIDVNYCTSSAVNIGKSNTTNNMGEQILFGPVIKDNQLYSENNLYGYPTFDILESESTFRDSYSNIVRKYKLGTKYKEYQNFIGDTGLFKDFFNSTDINNFLSQGWTYSTYTHSALTFSRTLGDESEYANIDGFGGEELKIEAYNKGGVLNLATPSADYLNRSNEKIEKSRYTIVEFDLLTYSNVSYNTIGGYPSDYTPKIHFNNLNLKRNLVNIYIPLFGSYNILKDAPFYYLPIYKNIEHTLTPNKRKIEYFYNKTSLSMNFKGNYSDDKTSIYVIDNLSFYEVDMIPFFQYFTDTNINKGIQIPYQGISPFIDYSNAFFSFINNISIGLDSITTKNSNTPIQNLTLDNISNINAMYKFDNTFSGT